jgi:hypothetical protein
MSIEIKINKWNDINVIIEDRTGNISFSNEFIQRGPFFKPLENFDFFKEAFVNIQDDLIEWPNGFGISIMELYDALEFSSEIEIR